MKTALVIGLCIVLLWLAIRLWLHFFGPNAQNLINNNQLTPCPSPLKCYFISVDLEKHPPSPTLLQQLQQSVESMPGSRIININDNYLYATYTTRLMGYTDDLECLINANTLHCRSASRVGRSDLGANKKRVKQLLAKTGIAPTQ